MTKALKISSIIVCMVLLISIVGCPKKAVKTEPIPPPPQPQVVEEPKPVMLKLGTVYFDYDKSDIRTADAEILKANSQALKNNPRVNIAIEGHCCPLGTAEYNMALGWRRANATQDYLSKLGVEKIRMTTISYGEERLVTERVDDYWKNRRCEFVQK